MAREAISGTWNEIAELWHAKSLKIIYIMFHRDVLVLAVLPFPVAISCSSFEVVGMIHVTDILFYTSRKIIKAVIKNYLLYYIDL